MYQLSLGVISWIISLYYLLFRFLSLPVTEKGLSISQESGISSQVLPLILADVSDPHHVVTDYMAAMPDRRGSKAKHENCQTRCRCVSRIVPGHSETTKQGCLSELLCLCWMQYVGRLVPINTNRHPQKSSGILVYLFFPLNILMSLFVIILA